MDWQGLSRKFASEHPHEPQVLARLDVALASAREALQIMAGHGYQYHLASGPGLPMPEWPKRLYHVDSAPNGVLVLCEPDAVALGPGWFDSFQKAQFWDGVEHQFQGRGGVPLSPRPPTIIFGNEVIGLNDSEARKLFIQAFKALNKWERPDALEEPKAEENNAGGEAQSSVRKANGNSSVCSA